MVQKREGEWHKGKCGAYVGQQWCSFGQSGDLRLAHGDQGVHSRSGGFGSLDGDGELAVFGFWRGCR